MTHEVAPAVFVIHQVAAVREAIQGGNAAMNSIIGPIFVTPLLSEGVRVRSDHAKRISALREGEAHKPSVTSGLALPQPQHPIIVDEAVRRTQPGC
jgi:hypothetical protein